MSEVFGHLVVLDQLHGAMKRCSLLDVPAVDYQTGRRRGVCAYVTVTAAVAGEKEKGLPYLDGKCSLR